VGRGNVMMKKYNDTVGIKSGEKIKRIKKKRKGKISINYQKKNH
jgi:hypothetical protein